MPNAFQSLSDDTYGPQFLHNAVVISETAAAAERLAAVLASYRGDRSLGIAAAVCSSERVDEPADLEGYTVTIEAQELDDLAPEDFDIVIFLKRPDGSDRSEILDTAWTEKTIFRRWEPQAEKGEEQIQELMTKMDDVAMRRACGAGTSC